MKTEGLKLSDYKVLLNKNFILILLIDMLLGFGNTLANTPIGLVASDIGMTADWIGVGATLYSFAIFLSRPIGGRLSDKYKARYVIIFALSVRIVSFILYAITQTTTMYMISRIIQGIAFAMAGCVLPAFIGKMVDPRILGGAYGIFLCAPVLLDPIAPQITVYIYENGGAFGSYTFAAGVVCVAAILCLFIKQEETNSAETDKTSENTPKIEEKGIRKYIAPEVLPIFVMNLFIGAIFSILFTFAVVHGEESGRVDAVLLFFSAYSATSIFVRAISGFVGDKFGESIIVTVGFIGMSIACLLVAFSGSSVFLAIGGVLYALGQSGCYPILQKLACELVPKEQRGKAIATYFLGADAAGIITGLVAGKLAVTVGYSYTFAIFATLPIIGIFVYMRVRKVLRSKMV